MLSSSAEQRAFSVRKNPRGVNDIVAMAAAVVAHEPTECREAVSMAVTELCENLVKYVEGALLGATRHHYGTLP